MARLARVGVHFQQHMSNKLFEHKEYIYRHGVAMPEIRDWT